MDKKIMISKLKNYWYYYKIHTLVVVFLLIGGIAAFSGRPEAPKYNFNVILAGEYMNLNEENALEEKLQSNIEFLGIGDKRDESFENPFLQKLMIKFAAGEFDLIVLDKKSFETYANQEGFLALDEIVNTVDFKNRNLKFLGTTVKQDGSKEHVYGIVLPQSEILQGVKYNMQDKVIAIYAKTKKKDKAVDILKTILK